MTVYKIPVSAEIGALLWVEADSQEEAARVAERPEYLHLEMGDVNSVDAMLLAPDEDYEQVRPEDVPIEAPEAPPELIAGARELYADDETAIDDDARMSVAEDGSGTWVQAWVWVPEAGKEQ